MTQWNKIVIKHKERLFRKELCETAGKINHRLVLECAEVTAASLELCGMSVGAVIGNGKALC